MLITLGKKGKPLDLSMLDQHALKTLGRHVKLGERLSYKELAKLGYLSAAAALSPIAIFSH